MTVTQTARRRSPLIRRHRLAAELRTLRDTAGLSTQELAAAIGVNRWKITRMENGERLPTVSDVTAILRALSLDDRSLWQDLVQLIADASERGWWPSYGKVMGARQLVYADLEWGARELREFQSYAVPGLLQAPEYTRARAELDQLDPRTVDQVVEAKITRARMLMRDDGPVYEVIIDETVIRRPSAPPPAMLAQVRHLASVASAHERMTIRVLPHSAHIRDYRIPRSPFSLYDYDDGDPRAAAVDTATTDLIYTDPVEVGPYVELYDRVRDAALSVRASVELLTAAAAALSPTEG